MAEAILRVMGERWRVEGEVAFANAENLRQQLSEGLQRQSGKLVLDLSRLDKANSAAVAVLVDFTRQCRQQQREMVIENMPAKLMDICRITGVHELLPCHDLGS